MASLVIIMTGLDDLVPIVNRIQDLVISNASCGSLDLPQVVVVGAQSSGKSSVIELLVKRDFLPRGTGIVTRRPLAITLINDKEEYFEFLHLKGEKLHSVDDVRSEIEKETFRIAGPDKGISRVPISLKVHAPDLLDLTLVDLPGVTKVPVGDQPADIEKQTKDLVFEYISNPNSIILAITPANQDIVNSESLNLARIVDPQGKRTLGVLTKLDLMDQGTDAVDVLSGQTYPLKLGFVGIVNRSQSDVINRKSLSDSIEAEKRFFSMHPSYRAMAGKLGTAYLASRLNQLLLMHIRNKLPDLRAKVNSLVSQTERELHRLGANSFDGNDRGPLVLTVMLNFAARFNASIEGTTENTNITSISMDINDPDTPDVSELSMSSPLNFRDELSGGARIYEIFSTVFEQRLSDLNPLSQLSMEDVRVAIRNSAGPRASLFVPEHAFDILIKPLIALFLAPAQQCVQLVYEELAKVSHSCADQDLKRFPAFKTRLLEVLNNLLSSLLKSTSSYIRSLVEIQSAYINTNHPRFVSAGDIVSYALQSDETENNAADRTIEAETTNVDDDSDASIEINAPESRSSPSASTAALLGSSFTPAANNSAAAAPGIPTEDKFLKYFFGKNDSKPSALPADKQANISAKDAMECRLMYKLLESYFQVVRETVSDQVPKAIMHFMVNSAKRQIQSRLITELYKEDLFDELLHEDENVVSERAKLAEALETYKTAASVLSEVL